MSDDTPLLTLAVLLKELEDVTDWRMLGAYLNVPKHVLDKINIEQSSVELCKLELLQYWLDTTMNPSWNNVARALEQINLLKLAARLKLKYLRTPLTTTPDVSSVQSLLPQTDPSTDPYTAALVAGVEVVSGLQDLESDFISMMTDTRKDLADCDIGEVQFYLDNLLGVKEFHKCQNIDEVLLKLRHDRIDTFNIRYFECLVRRFHQSDAIIKTIEKYEEKKEEFLRSTTVKAFQRAIVSRVETVTPRRMATIMIGMPKEYGVPRIMKDMEMLAKKGFLDHCKDLVRINVIPGGPNWSFSSKKEVVLKELEQKAVQAVPATTDMAVQVEQASPYELTSEDVIHAYDISLRASKEKEQQLKSQLATVQKESQDRGEQLSKAEDENYNLHKERLVLKHANELQQEELKRMQQTVSSEYEARLEAGEEEQQRLLQVVEQWKKMFHSREMEISQLQKENEQLTKDKLSASNLQQLKDHNVKSTETDITAQKAVLSLCDKSDNKWSVATVDTGVQANYLAVAPDFLRGVEVYGETVLEVVGDKPQKLEWPGYGFFIEVPKGALSPGVTASVAVKVILEGQFKLPENSQFISAIYWIASGEVFKKEVAVNIQHYAVIRSEEQCSKFRFIIAKCSQEVLPYTFREKKGLFSTHTQYGAIKVKRFSIFSQIGPEGSELRFTSLKFYKPIPSPRYVLVDFVFVVVCNHEPFLEYVRRQYRSYSEDRQTHMLVFDQDVMVLDLLTAKSKPKVIDGWKILPLTHPQIAKVDIEQYQCGKNVPGCTIELEWTGKGEPERLSHQVNIIGAKKPENYFHLRYCPQPIDTLSTTIVTEPDVEAPPTKRLKLDPLQSAPEIKDLHNKVASKALHKWKRLGTQLNIEYSKLTSIEEKHRDAFDCYAEIFQLWKNKGDPPFTWATIIDALKASSVEETELATELQELLCKQ